MTVKLRKGRGIDVIRKRRQSGRKGGQALLRRKLAQQIDTMLKRLGLS